jgi:hypothetical protein
MTVPFNHEAGRAMRSIWVIPMLWCLAGNAEAFFCFGFGGGSQRGGHPQPYFATPAMLGPAPIYSAAGIASSQYPIHRRGASLHEIGFTPARPDPVEYQGWRFRPLK